MATERGGDAVETAFRGLDDARLLQELAPPRRFFLLALHTWLFVVLAPPRFRENALLLDFLIETLERCLETFVITDDYFGQPPSPPIKDRVASIRPPRFAR